MSKKEETTQADQEYVSRHSLETLLSVSLSVPIVGDPSSPNVTWGLPSLYWGPPGIGKSERVESAAARLGLPCEVIFPSTMQPEDINGVLVPDGKGGATKVCMIDGVRALIEARKGVLFIDELTGARPATQGALLGAILKRQFGDVKMPKTVRIIAAANPPEHAAGGWDLEPPMANRFAHFDIAKPQASEWVDYLMSEDLPRDTSIVDYEDLVRTNWGSAWARSRGFFAGFQKKTSGRLLNQMPAEGGKRGRAWPSSRTWWFAARSVATCLALSSVLQDGTVEDLMLDFVTATIGPGASGEFNTWLREANLPSPEDVLRDGWIPDKLRIDRNYAVYTSMTTFVIGTKSEEQKLKRALQAYGVLEVASDAGIKDLILPHVGQLMNRGMGPSMYNSPEPLKKRVGEAAVRLGAKLGKTKLSAYIKDFREVT